MGGSNLLTVGWREWVSLPELGIPMIKAKVDTGARTTALHAFDIEETEQDGIRRIAFKTHPLHRDDDTVISCQADLIDERVVTNSGGQQEERWVIGTQLSVGPYSWPIEVTLTTRSDMRFRMLIGRTAINRRALVDPSRSYLLGKKPRREKRLLSDRRVRA